MILPPILNKAFLGGLKKFFSKIVKATPFTRQVLLAQNYLSKINIENKVIPVEIETSYLKMQRCDNAATLNSAILTRYTIKVTLYPEPI